MNHAQVDMKTFKEHLKSYLSDGGYIALKVTPESRLRIVDTMSNFGINNIINNLHMTLMFDVSEPYGIPYTPSREQYSANIIDIDMLGDEDSPWRAIVFKLQSTALSSRFEQLKQLGFKHSYDTFVPHVSIIYKPSIDDIATIMSNKESIIGVLNTIELGYEYNEPINKPNPSTA